MGKKQKAKERQLTATAEAAAAQPETRAASPAAPNRQELRQMEQAERQRRKAWKWLLPLGAALFLLTGLAQDDGLKVCALLVMLFAAAVTLWRRGRVRGRFGLLALAVTAYCVMVTAACLYAPSGKYALREGLRLMLAYALFLLALAAEPERGERSGRCAATVVECYAALVSVFSLDFAGTRLLTTPLFVFFRRATTFYQGIDAIDRGRLGTIFGNLNVYAGVAGLAILLSLGLLSGETDRRARRAHLACLGINATVFLCTFSRAATGVLAAAFLVYLFLERGEARGRALVVMVETLAFSAAAAAAGYAVGFDAEGAACYVPMAATLLSAAVLVFFDELAGVRLAARLAPHPKAVTGTIAGVLGAAAVFAVAAVTLTGPMEVLPYKQIGRAIYPAAGENTLRVDVDGDLVIYGVERSTGRLDGNRMELLSDDAVDGTVLDIPEGTEVVMLYFFSRGGATLRGLSLESAEKTSAAKLRYYLLPESIAGLLQGMRQSDSFVQRRVYLQDALKLWRTNPVLGRGVAAFENDLASVQTYTYQSRYVHNHYVQTMLEMGVVGLLLFVALLVSCALSVVFALRQEKRSPLLPALGAAVLFMAGQAYTDVIFSSGFYLPCAFLTFAVTACACGGTLLPKKLDGKARTWLARGARLLLAAWLVMLTLNLYAQMELENPSYGGLETAAKIDCFEYNDYIASYVLGVAEMEEPPEHLRETMYRYLDKLKKSGGRQTPYHIAEAYFLLGQTEDAFAQLREYLRRSASLEMEWNMAFQLAMEHYEDTDAYRAQMRELYARLEEWNAASTTPIKLGAQWQGFMEEAVGIE